MKKAPPKISVILPVYNPGESVRRCLRSLQGQTLSDIEIIFIDDRGSDASMDIIREEAGTHFDPDVAAAFLHAEEEVRRVSEMYHET